MRQDSCFLSDLVRSSASLFLPLLETLVLTAGAYPLLASLMDQTMPDDFSPVMRGVLVAQLVLVIACALGHLALGFMDRTSLIVPEAGAEVPEGKGAAPRERVLEILSKRISYRNTMGISNLYCTSVCTLLALHVTMIAQAASGAGLDSSSAGVQNRMTLDATMDNNTLSQSSYASSTRLDWIQSVAGSSGWVKQVREVV